VLADPLLRNFMQSGGFNFSWSGFLARAGFALLMAIVLLPAVEGFTSAIACPALYRASTIS